MQTAPIEKTTKTKTKDAARTLADAEEQTTQARSALETARADEAAAALAYENEMSEPRMQAWRDASERRERCERQLTAFEGRERRAREAHEAADKAGKRAELDALVREHDAERFMREQAGEIVPAAVDVDRALHDRITRTRARVRARREAIARATALAAELGIALDLPDVSTDDLRVMCGVAIARDRAEAQRETTPTELFLTPILDAYERPTPNAPKEVNPLCPSPELFETAVRVVDTIIKK